MVVDKDDIDVVAKVRVRRKPPPARKAMGLGPVYVKVRRQRTVWRETTPRRWTT